MAGAILDLAGVVCLMKRAWEPQRDALARGHLDQSARMVSVRSQRAEDFLIGGKGHWLLSLSTLYFCRSLGFGNVFVAFGDFFPVSSRGEEGEE